MEMNRRFSAQIQKSFTRCSGVFTYMSRVMKWSGAVILSLGLVVSQPALADQWKSQQLSPGDLRPQVQKGKIVKLKKIHKMLKGEFGGFHVATDLYSRDDNSGNSDYHIQWVTGEGEGKKTLFIVDAQTGDILSNSTGDEEPALIVDVPSPE